MIFRKKDKKKDKKEEITIFKKLAKNEEKGSQK